MADVFGKLNEFLNKEDDSFKFDMSITHEDDSLSKETSEDDLKNQSEVISIDSNFEENDFNYSLRSKRKRKTNAISKDPDESFDLTEDFDVPIGKSRRKLADEIEAIDGGEIDLSDIPISEPNEIEQNIPNVTRRGRGRGARGRQRGGRGRALRKVSYKKALEILNQPIPDHSPSEIDRLHSSSTTLSRRISNRRSVNANAVDLTGEVEMGPQHSKAPLFQNSNNTKTSSNNEKQSKSNSFIKNDNNSWNEEEDDDLDSIKINVRIKGVIKKFTHYTDRRFYDLFKKIADSENVPISNVFCFLQDKRVYPESTPDSIGHKISSIYNCKLMDASALDVTNRKDKIELKFQSDKWKRPISLKVSRVGTFLSFLNMLCEQIEFSPNQISLSFDGDSIDVKTTPMDNDFEGGEILDCRIKT